MKPTNQPTKTHKHKKKEHSHQPTNLPNYPLLHCPSKQCCFLDVTIDSIRDYRSDDVVDESLEHNSITCVTVPA